MSSSTKMLGDKVIAIVIVAKSHKTNISVIYFLIKLLLIFMFFKYIQIKYIRIIGIACAHSILQYQYCQSTSNTIGIYNYYLLFIYYSLRVLNLLALLVSFAHSKRRQQTWQFADILVTLSIRYFTVHACDANAKCLQNDRNLQRLEHTKRCMNMYGYIIHAMNAGATNYQRMGGNPLSIRNTQCLHNTQYN